MKSLLFVDDDPGVIASLRQLFESEYKIYTAKNSREGIILFQKMHPDVVCLDLHLPDENGLETLKAIKQNNAKACVVILTGYATPVARHESRRLGVVDFLNKPFDGNYLKKRVNEIVFADGASLSDEPPFSLPSPKSKDSEKLKEIDYASSGFLHDISSPLSAISLLSDLLQEKIEKDGRAYEFREATKIARLLKLNSEYMSALVEQWRAFAEPDNLVKHKVTVRDVIEHAGFLVQDKINSKRVQFSIHLAAGEQMLHLNRFALSRVLANILTNAIEAVEPDSGKVEVHIRREVDNVHFIIRDNGPGIHVKPVELIFEPRFSTKPTGTGMGLFISKRVLEAFKGQISVGTRDQGGTEFTIRVPIIS